MKISKLKFKIENAGIIFLVLAALVGIAYFNSLNNGLVSDDEGLLKEGANLVSPGYIFSDPFSFVRNLIYALIYQLCGIQAGCFRALNIGFHVGNALLVYLLVRKLLRWEIGLIAAAIFAVHPLLTEAVTWISGGPYSQYTFFFLLSLYFYSRQSEKNYFYWLSLGSFVLALLSSNRTLVLGLVFVVYEYSFGPPSASSFESEPEGSSLRVEDRRSKLRQNWRRIRPFLGLSLVWLMLYGSQIGKRAATLETTYYRDGGWYNPFIQWPLAISSYLELFVWPDRLTFVHSNNQTLPQYLGRLLVLGGYLAALAASFVKNRKLFFFLSLFLISLLPTLTPLKIAFIVAERYSYLGSIGLIVILAWGLFKVLQVKELRLAIYLGIVIILGALVIRTHLRNTDWQTSETLWQATSRANPDSSQAHLNIGSQYGKEGNMEKAAQEFQKAIAINPNLPQAYYNLGVVYIKTGQKDKAREQFQKALDLKPDYLDAQRGLAVSEQGSEK